MRTDKAILSVNENICKNITQFNATSRGFISQNILSQLRNFIEYIAIKIYANGQDVDPYDQDVNKKALQYLKSQGGSLRFLHEFHQLLQKSVSHYTFDENGSERLMLKYYEFLLKLKSFLKNRYNISVLEKIKDFPLKLDTENAEYYAKIAEKICAPCSNALTFQPLTRYYIQKITPFFVDAQIFYEVSFVAANNRPNKFDRITAFTQCDIFHNYAVQLKIRRETLEVVGRKMDIQIIDDWKVSIRPCELNNFAKILGIFPTTIKAQTVEYQALMQFLTQTRRPLSELIIDSDEDYARFKENIARNFSSQSQICATLDQCRSLALSNAHGTNTIRYLLYRLNNQVIKSQYEHSPCDYFSNLHLNPACIPFDKMPFCTSLKNHNPPSADLFACFSTQNREHELLARRLKNNVEIKKQLFTPTSEITQFDDVQQLVTQYNKLLYYKHWERRLLTHNNHFYFQGYVNNAATIIRTLQSLASQNAPEIKPTLDEWLTRNVTLIDSEEKRDILSKVFTNSRVAFIYGSAGSGKTTLINYISEIFAERPQLFLANTHSAVEALRAKITAPNSEFKTVASLSVPNTEYALLVVDESSTISNKHMLQVLEKTKFKFLLVVGDTFQIESIQFGNWFKIAENFIPKHSIFKLKETYRTRDDNLKLLWARTRDVKPEILETLVKNDYTARLDASFFQRGDTKDEIVLCLNYDGLYGINNISRFLQNANPNPTIVHGLNYYKAGDPILFVESTFSPHIHNNDKGYIRKVSSDKNQTTFEIELARKLVSPEGQQEYPFELVECLPNGNSIIRFSVARPEYDNEDAEETETDVPFQIAYAVSIHKAQGLEYESVKIVINDDIERQITHNIFYTAITRAKKRLKIYWSPETEKEILSRFKKGGSNQEAYLLANLQNLSLTNQ
ncbi:MAG: AAA family ATPase [Thermoguttaceae bacterium]|nr:AAA family ATPase [Thermoguttaceae bacterium]